MRWLTRWPMGSSRGRRWSTCLPSCGGCSQSCAICLAGSGDACRVEAGFAAGPNRPEPGAAVDRLIQGCLSQRTQVGRIAEVEHSTIGTEEPTAAPLGVAGMDTMVEFRSSAGIHHPARPEHRDAPSHWRARRSATERSLPGNGDRARIDLSFQVLPARSRHAPGTPQSQPMLEHLRESPGHALGLVIVALFGPVLWGGGEWLPKWI